MKDIQKIMKEMNNISGEIAVDLGVDSALLAGLADVSPTLSCDCTDACSGSGTGGDVVCADLPTEPVESICAITAPCGFSFPVDLEDADIRIAYNLNFLTFRVQSCICEDVTRYAVRVSGHIPYIVNVPIDTTNVCTNTDEEETVYACCHNCAEVDNVLGFACNIYQAFAALIAIRTRLGLCEGIDVILTPAVAADNVVTVTVTFEFNQCTDPAIVAVVAK